VTHTVFALIALHFLCDFPLQGEFLARGKHHRLGLAGVPWPICLFAHAFIQSAGVALILPLPFAAAELGAHATIDWCKSEGLLGLGERGFWFDQALHILLRVLWATLAVAS
jgi:hypothetical protein